MVHRLVVRRRVLSIALILILLASMILNASTPSAASGQELLTNGNFEAGFAYQAGCGMVGKGWTCFTNGGAVRYGFFDDQWRPVVYDGGHSQLITMNTNDANKADADRYAGIYQTVNTVSGADYTLTIRGIIRADDKDPDPWRYRVQWGYDATGGNDWTKVTNWTELPWDNYYPRLQPGGISEYRVSFKAPGSRLTLFVRVWKKWAMWYRELNVNLDGISLYGSKPAGAPAAPASPTVTPTPSQVVTTCGGANLIANGGFENGFQTSGVGVGWGWFTTAGLANYGFYDETWPRAVASGGHAQLIEINSKGLALADANRYAGIYQTVSNLTAGATYELSLKGMMREEAPHAGEDPWRYRVQWGTDGSGGTDWTKVTNWIELPWDNIYLRTDPGAYQSYTIRLVAPSSKVTFFFRAWKKWGTPERELDVDLDDITLRRCTTAITAGTIYTVRAGDTLTSIAARYGTTVAAIAAANGIRNVNLIYVGQKLLIPGAATGDPPPSGGTPTTYRIHTVRRGETLAQIAARYGTSVSAIARLNSLRNVNLIYVGQRLRVPAT